MSIFNDYPDDVMELKGSATIPGKGTVTWHAPVLTPEERKVRLQEIGDGLACTYRKRAMRLMSEGKEKEAEEFWRSCFAYPPPPWLDNKDGDENGKDDVK